MPGGSPKMVPTLSENMVGRGFAKGRGGGGAYTHLEEGRRVVLRRAEDGARGRRAVPLPASIMPALPEHKRRPAAERLKAGAGYQTNGLLFATRDGGPILLRTLERLHFKPTLKRAKLT